MPTASYEELLIETLPQVIETAAQYRQIARRFGDLVGKGRTRSAEETKLLRLLALLVEDYGRRHELPPDKSTPAEKLQFLLEHSGKTATDLQSVFGQRSAKHQCAASAKTRATLSRQPRTVSLGKLGWTRINARSIEPCDTAPAPVPQTARAKVKTRPPA